MPRRKGKMPIQEYDIEQSLYTNTRRLLKADKRPLRMISNCTNIPYYWLKKFSAGEIAAPNVNRIQYLYEFLSKSKLIK